MIVGGETEIIGLQKRSGHWQKWYDEVLGAAHPYRQSFRNLSLPQRTKRMGNLAKLVMACCVNKQQMKHNGVTYFIKNEELAVDVITVLDSLQSRLQYELKVNLNLIRDSFTPLTACHAQSKFQRARSLSPATSKTFRRFPNI